MESSNENLGGSAIDIDAFRKANMEYLKDPKGKVKPKPGDFILKKEK